MLACATVDHCDVATALGSAPQLAARTQALTERIINHIARYPELSFVIGLSLLLPLMRWVLETVIYKPISRQILQRAKQERAPKMCESFWKMTAYGSMLLLELSIVHREAWFWRPKDYWVGWPNQPELPLMRLLFFAQLAYYISTTFTLALWEVPRSDYWVMQTHHCCTVVLIYYNYISGYQRWGCLIMMLHDINDVIMEIAKCLNYAELHAAANTVFALFVAAWAGLRLYAFPAILIRSTLFDSVRVLGYTPPHYNLLNSLLCVLCCFHVYWFGLILRVAYMTLRKGQGEDIREKED
ncbi:hypothetical protein Vretimale_774 [Volvox reticuliferus]|uniref:Uncharacterized protein n=1 Tax=Volvox reticuliferus TaxID=1737510 RepID=A0A8J4C548_9CHLO|nr:hypothetical protein Vretifemale_2094 [Volvox reticuliferus]GIL94542.1 hypothetical protein Vretimale_774 [Volvox reticuliferus]